MVFASPLEEARAERKAGEAVAYGLEYLALDIDGDDHEPDAATRTMELERLGHKVVSWEVLPSASGNVHVLIKLDKPVATYFEQVALQQMLGSSPGREARCLRYIAQYPGCDVSILYVLGVDATEKCPVCLVTKHKNYFVGRLCKHQLCIPCFRTVSTKSCPVCRAPAGFDEYVSSLVTRLLIRKEKKWTCKYCGIYDNRCRGHAESCSRCCACT